MEEDRKFLEELEDENQNIGNLRDPYNELWRSPWDKDPWKRGSIMNHPNFSKAIFIFYFLFFFNYWMCGNLLPTQEQWLYRKMQEKDNVYK